MLRNRTARLILVAVVVLLAFCLPAPVLAQEPAPCNDPDTTLDWPAGIACSFALHVDSCDNENRPGRDFYDKDGNRVRSISAGKGSTLTYTNLSNGKSLTTRANGSVGHTTYHPDGSSTLELGGHNVVIMFPSDNPPGPSTTLYTGNVVIDIDALGNWNLVKVTGPQLDICAALQQ